MSALSSFNSISTASSPSMLFLPKSPLTKPPSSPYHPILDVYSVRIEEKPLSLTKTPPNTKITTQSPPPSPSTATTTTQSSPTTTTINTKSPKEYRRAVKPTLPMLMFSAFDNLINTFIDPPSRPSIDPRNVLSGNFAPVNELPPTECQVIEGCLPPCLDGAYIRNGPNPQFLPRGPYHIFEGDGMLHSIRISQGKATLCSRYVKTYKYIMEREAGFPLLPNMFSGFSGLTASVARGALFAARVLAGQFNPANGVGTANTSLAFFGNELYALGESDLPYAVRLTPGGDIETVGRQDFDGKLLMRMTAHPKTDIETVETFAFRYGFAPPFLTYFRFDANGNKQSDVTISSITRPCFLHDLAITKKYAIFADLQIGMNLPKLILGGGSLFSSDPVKIPRLGVIPRYAKDESEMQWFDVPGFNIFHAINAWDEEEAVVMLAPNFLPVEHTLDRIDLAHASVEKVRLNLKTGIVTRSSVSARNLDLAVINPAYIGKQNRFVYAAVGDPMPWMSGVVKLDLSKEDSQECTVASRMHGPQCYGGEPFFIAREPDNPDAEEDDGYIVSYVHNETSGESKFIVMDAKSENLDIVAAVKLPQRVPYGFHGLFVRESDLLNNYKWNCNRTTTNPQIIN